MHKTIVDRWPYGQNNTADDIDDIDALRKSEANLNAILNNADSGYALYDSSLCIIAYNSLAQELSLTLYGKRLAKGRHLLSYFPENRHEILKDITNRVLHGEKISYELCFTIDNVDMWVEVKWINVSNPEKKNWGFILASKDITKTKQAAIERERITTELSNRNKALEQFANIISHNLRAPVANIINLIDVIALVDTVEEKESMLNLIYESSQSLDRVIKDIHHILKAKQHISDLKESIDLKALVDDIKLSINHIITQERAIIQYNFHCQEFIFSIRSFIYNILYNLILNSLKYRHLERAPKVMVTSNKTDNIVRLKVADNGKGIDLAKHGGNLFGLYKRFDPSVDGSGLGLFMVKSQVEELGGTISVESEPGVGTTFLIDIPFEAAEG